MTEKISCRVSATAPGLTFTANLDGQELWRGDPWGGHDLSVDLSNDNGLHVLTLELSGKTAEHTKVDRSGDIMQDITVSVECVSFDDIELGHLFYEKAVYHHDFNGTGETTQERFYGIMGCNGVVSLEFTTPIYLWLLETM